MVRHADLVEETIQEQVASRKFGPSKGISVNNIFFQEEILCGPTGNDWYPFMKRKKKIRKRIIRIQ